MFSQITLVGRLGSDPTMRFTPGGKPVTTFSLATSRSYTDSAGKKVEETAWWRVSVWGPQAEFCNQYLSKGSAVLVVGRLRPDPETGGPRVYTRKDGTTGASFEVTAENVRFLPSVLQQQEGMSETEIDDGLPF